MGGNIAFLSELHIETANFAMCEGKQGGTYSFGDALGVPLDGFLAEELAAVDARQLQPQYEQTNNHW